MQLEYFINDNWSKTQNVITIDSYKSLKANTIGAKQTAENSRQLMWWA